MIFFNFCTKIAKKSEYIMINVCYYPKYDYLFDTGDEQKGLFDVCY